MAVPAQKVNIYSVNDLKNATDDALTPYLTTLPIPYTFTRSNRTTDIRLAVGYTSALLAAALFYVDYKYGWEVTKPYTAPACIAYMALNGFLTYWVWMVEAGTVFSGTRVGGQKLTLKSSVRKHSPVYTLKVRYSAPQTGKVWEDKTIEGKFTDWFDVNGYLQQKELRKWLAGNIEVLRLANSEGKQAAPEKTQGATIKDAAPATTVPPVAEGEGSQTLSSASSNTAKARKTRKKV